jgi:hypothetical protein
MQCGAKTRSGGACKARPMPSGRCRMHGGKDSGRPVTHGRYSLAHRAKLAEKAQEFIDDPEPGNLASELALMRALLQEYLERWVTGTNPGEKQIVGIMGMVEAIGRMVERIAKIESLTALTQAEVRLLQARFADIISRYIDDPRKRLQLVDELEADPVLYGRAARERHERATTLEG